MKFVPDRCNGSKADQLGVTNKEDLLSKSNSLERLAPLRDAKVGSQANRGSIFKGADSAKGIVQNVAEREHYDTWRLLSKSTDTVASNDPRFEEASALPIGLTDLSALVSACREMLDAPVDLPISDKAFSGLALAIRSLTGHNFGAHQIAVQIEKATTLAIMSAATGATVLALSRRAGRHLIYGLSVEIGNLPTATSLDELSLGIFGAWCLRRLFGDSYPSSYAIAKVQTALVRPNSAQSRAWTDKARARAFSRALRDLDYEIKTNESAATRYGLSHAEPKATRSTDVIEVFNRKFRRRVDNLTEFSTIKAIAGAGGYGTLCAAGLLGAGRALMDRVRAGDKAAVLVCLEILTHLTSEIVLKLPLQEGCEPSAGALAWIDVRTGSYFQSLYRLVERGARPVVGTEHLYEETSQIIEVQLHPIVHAFLLEAMNGARWTASSVEDLLGAVGHHPRSSVVGDSIYRSTARRLQESVPALLLGAGHHRWLVALATNSHFLVSRGRPSYGACQASDIDATTNAAYRLLGWPTDDLRSTRLGLVGSFTTPKSVAITAALNFLADEADAANLDAHDLSGLIQRVNRSGRWLALLLALGYALRSWTKYELRADELRLGESLHFDDKDVHEHKGPPVPTARFVHRALCGWFALCAATLQSLRLLGDSRSLNLAGQIEMRLGETVGVKSIFTIDAVDHLEAVGWRTWGVKLPENLRLRPSFARQFWPMQLMKQGVGQLLIDILMRHQIESLHIGSSNSVKKKNVATERLRTAMDEVLKSLDLRMPICLELMYRV